MAINVRGSFECCKAVIPGMKRRQYGKIVNVTSSTVLMGVPMMLHYVTSKGAVMAMTRAMARELGDHNICVNCIAPGLTMSEAVRANFDGDRLRANVAVRSFKREQVPNDLIGTVLFLSSEDSDFITGQTIIVDGGVVMH
jgi:NAD(P)-dependent dehydrogenase (short-subunit alcohol dehydrogenase family)